MDKPLSYWHTKRSEHEIPGLDKPRFTGQYDCEGEANQREADLQQIGVMLWVAVAAFKTECGTTREPVVRTISS